MARRADLVFARDELAVLCDREGIGYVPLTGFTRALRELDRRLGERPGASRP
jgi:2-hydroxy-3-keto-5-methylthiopentenyl-1-phosphate phosphatase